VKGQSNLLCWFSTKDI